MENKIKTHPCIKAYFDNEQIPGIVVEQLLTKRKFIFNSPIILEILRICSGVGQKENTLQKKIYSNWKISKEESTKIIRQLTENELVVIENTNNIEKTLNPWEEFCWKDALDYYIATYNYPFLSYEEPDCYIRDKEWMRIYKDEKSPPSVYKDYNSLERIPLLKDIEALDNYNIFDFLKNSTEAPVNKLSSFEKLSHLLFFTFGKTGKIKFPNQGDYILKMSPSGGSRHPTEAYICILDPELIENKATSGIFHYSVRHHSLDRLSLDFDQNKILNAAFELQIGPKFPLKAILVLSSVVERSMWRYREPRSYRVILNDIGHLLETLRIVASSIGIKTYSGHGYNDSKLETIIGIDSIREPAMRIIGIG